MKIGHDIEMVNEEGYVFNVAPFAEGSYYARTGDMETTTEICVTYNYAWFFYKFMDKEKGIKAIYGLSGKEALPLINKMLDELCTPRCFGNGDQLDHHKVDYFHPTPSNVGNVLRLLKSWCETFPEGIFRGD